MRLWGALLILLALLQLAHAAPTPVLTSLKVSSGNSFLLSDGRHITLRGIKAPEELKPFTEKARLVLETTLRGQHLVVAESKADAHGSVLADVYILNDDGSKTSVQLTLLKSGFVYIDPLTEHEAHLADMFRAESAARRSKSGLWSEEHFIDTSARDASNEYQHFSFITGHITDIARIKDTLYLHFGPHWQKDFTVAMHSDTQKRFADAHIDPMSYWDKDVRVRGYVTRGLGPTITIQNPAQIEILDQP